MSFNKILSLVLSKKPLNFDNFEELCNEGAYPLTKNKDGYNILQLAQKDWKEADYLRILSICEKNNKMRNSDFTKAYSSFCVHTHMVYFNVIQKFFDLGADPNAIIIRGNSHRTLLQWTCSESTWNAAQKLYFIEIIANSKKVAPQTFMEACKLYVESTSEIDPTILKKLTNLSKEEPSTNLNVQPKQEIKEPSTNHTNSLAAIDTSKPAFIKIKWYHYLIPGALKKIEMINTQREDRFYAFNPGFQSSTGMMLDTIPGSAPSNERSYQSQESSYDPIFHSYDQLYPIKSSDYEHLNKMCS